MFTALAMEVEDLALLQRAGVRYSQAARARAPRLHLLSMGLSGSCLWGELLGPNAGRPYIFEPFNGGSSMWNHSSALLPNVRDGWNVVPSSYDFADLRTRLRCIYMCEGCKDAVTGQGEAIMSTACKRPAEADMVVVKTVRMNNASSLTTMLPEHVLLKSKFVLLLRDPRATYRTNACQRMLSLALSMKQLAAVVGKSNVRVLFLEKWALNISESLRDVASWAGIPASTELLQRAYASQRPRDTVTKWLSKGIPKSVGEQEWCKEFFDLVGYPALSTISFDPPSIDYAHLADPSQTPWSPEHDEILARLWKAGAAFSF